VEASSQTIAATPSQSPARCKVSYRPASPPTSSRLRGHSVQPVARGSKVAADRTPSRPTAATASAAPPRRSGTIANAIAAGAAAPNARPAVNSAGDDAAGLAS
jgi:hypothetical protein